MMLVNIVWIIVEPGATSVQEVNCWLSKWG